MGWSAWARLFLAGAGVVFAVFGLWGLLTPAAMLRRFGVELASREGRTAIRAMYGGFLLGAAALFLFCAAAAPRAAFGLEAVLLITGPILLARLAGLAIDRAATAYHLSYAALELAGLIGAAGLLYEMRIIG